MISLSCCDNNGHHTHTLTAVRPLTDVVVLRLRPPHPGVVALPFGHDFVLLADRQSHLIGRVDRPVQAAPAQRGGATAVHQRQRLAAQVQRQAGGRVHVEEPVT